MLLFYLSACSVLPRLGMVTESQIAGRSAMFPSRRMLPGDAGRLDPQS
jgi:hypothetical protein